MEIIKKELISNNNSIEFDQKIAINIQMTFERQHQVTKCENYKFAFVFRSGPIYLLLILCSFQS